jgi:hypothetical protein
MTCDCFYDENGDRWYCEDCQYEDECDQDICVEHKMCLLPKYHKLIRELILKKSKIGQ